MLSACGNREKVKTSDNKDQNERIILADELEESLFRYIIEPWYPANIDSLNGGYNSIFNYNWSLPEKPGMKALVQQARHVWSTSFLYECYPSNKDFLKYARHGSGFLKDQMWDKEYGGFYYACEHNGLPDPESMNDKRIYGQSFALYGLSKYYMVSGDQEILDLVKKEFLWMEEQAHDAEHGGYFEYLNRDGSPKYFKDLSENQRKENPSTGLKDYNSSIHLMEAFTELYRIWPDELVKTRLEEMFYLIRDTFVHPDGYLILFFYPDWVSVPSSTMDSLSGGNYFYTQHFSYGHDVETAFLLLETSEALGLDHDKKTLNIARKLVDHSLQTGWDDLAGGFYDAGRKFEDGTRIIDRHKSWWAQVEGLNALLMMAELFPEDTTAYFNYFEKQWDYINTNLVDKEFGGWYNFGLDTYPESRFQPKSHIWKTTYHNIRGMVRCIRMLRGTDQVKTETENSG